MCSEVFDVSEFVSADRAAERVLLSIRRVLHLQGALWAATALGQFVLRIARHVVALNLPRVTRLTEVGVAPAEPL